MPEAPYSIAARCPTVDEYLHLRQVCGLSAFSAAAAELGLPRSIFAVVVEVHGQAIGMGRIIGDGGCFFQITDIAVDPAHQGKGLSKHIMNALMDHVLNELPDTAYVSLIADKPADRLYRQYGFAEVSPASVGMALRRS
ncbi:GNAT family N-acetyltransferase [Paracoccus albus]|uniref:GNAT family N-acetyltransferase n=1 Tax=Paracoccus albus TaxID=3017784 RepID=UPI0022F024D7|nr:GNAT family N-acetyltransferase [Paracoccus albus]WBU61559.1 GNAT family N-acetyltransferase [Paracoccus albus]